MYILRQKIYFQSRTTGEYYTGEELQKEAAKIRENARNGSEEIYDSKGNRLKGETRKINRGNSIREAYVNKNLGMNKPIPSEEWEDFKKKQNKAYGKLEKGGLIKNVKRGSDGNVKSYEHAGGKVLRSTPKPIKKLLKFLKR